MAGSLVVAACRSHPVALAVVVSSAKTSAADLVVQTQVEGRGAVDWRRNAVFAAFGAGYLGGVQYCLYAKLMPRLFGRSDALPWRARAASVAAQVGFDQFLHVPFVFFPCFYVLKESMERERVDAATAGRGLARYRENAAADLAGQLAIFLPGAVVNFAVVPLWLRTPWAAGVSFVYTLHLSSRRGAAPD